MGVLSAWAYDEDHDYWYCEYRSEQGTPIYTLGVSGSFYEGQHFWKPFVRLTLGIRRLKEGRKTVSLAQGMFVAVDLLQEALDEARREKERNKKR